MPKCACKQFVEINYQDILEEILEPSLEMNIDERIRFILKEYIRCLGLPIFKLYNSNDIKKLRKQNTIIMATSTEVSKMLNAFWEKNERLLIAVMSTIANDPNQDSDIREKAEGLFKAASIAEKDKTHYRFLGNEYKGKNAIVVAVLSYLIMNYSLNPNDISQKWVSFLENQKGTINDLSGDNWTRCKHLDYKDSEIKKVLNGLKKRMKKGQLIYDASNNINRDSCFEHNYSQIEINNRSYWYYNQWGWKNIDYFIKFYRTVYGQNNIKDQIEII